MILINIYVYLKLRHFIFYLYKIGSKLKITKKFNKFDFKLQNRLFILTGIISTIFLIFIYEYYRISKYFIIISFILNYSLVSLFKYYIYFFNNILNPYLYSSIITLSFYYFIKFVSSNLR